MFKDNRDDIESNEDVDLTGMIHQYNEDNELRRKINEMKKQKEEGIEKKPTFDPNDSAFINVPKDNFSGIPDIRVDHDLEKTRVNFNDDSDKTLVIMDRKNKVEQSAQSTFEDYPYQESNTSKSALHQEVFEEEVTETKRRPEKTREVDHVEEDEKSKKVNKVITYVIIGILSIVLLVGAGFGIKYMFFNGSTDESTKEPTKKDDPNTTKKDPVKEPDKNETDIKDNSAVIKQLNSQIDAYEGQLKQVQDDIASTESAKTAAQEKSNNVYTLRTNRDTLEKDTAEALKLANTAEQTSINACKVGSPQKECDEAKANYEAAKQNYESIKGQYELAKLSFEGEEKKDPTYIKEVQDADAKIVTLKTKKTDLEAKIADKVTELAKYE